MCTVFIGSLVVNGVAIFAVGASWLLWWVARRPHGILSAAMLLSANLMLVSGVSRLLTAAAAAWGGEWVPLCVWSHFACAVIAAPVAVLFCLPAGRESMPTRSTAEWQAQLKDLGALRELAIERRAADVVEAAINSAVEKIRAELKSRLDKA